MTVLQYKVNIATALEYRVDIATVIEYRVDIVLDSRNINPDP